VQRSKGIAFLALALGVAALVVSLCISREPGHPTLEHQLTAEEFQLREQLKLQGRGLDQPVSVRSYASSVSEQIIRSTGRRLEAEGFRIVVQFSADDGPLGPKNTWILHADLQMIPSPENLCSLRERVKRWVESNGAHYDGWGPPGQP
jgi:hypothetical protein